MRITLHRWDAGDLPLLVEANTPEMTRYLGGPESDDDVRARHEKYLRFWDTGEGWMYRIDVDGVPAGGIGYWPVVHDGEAAYETGWNVSPGFQGRGVAREALRQILAVVRADGRRRLLVASPGVDNPASNALCRSAGFELRGSSTAPWRGGELTYHTWVLDLSRLVAAGARAGDRTGV